MAPSPMSNQREATLAVLQRERVARLATADRDGVPHIVPIVFALATPDMLVSAIDHKPKSTHDLKRLRNISERPEVSILFDHYDDDWSRLWWIRVDGTATIHIEDVDRERLIEALIAKYVQYVERPPRGPVITIDIHHMRSWSASADALS